MFVKQYKQGDTIPQGMDTFLAIKDGHFLYGVCLENCTTFPGLSDPDITYVQGYAIEEGYNISEGESNV